MRTAGLRVLSAVALGSVLVFLLPAPAPGATKARAGAVSENRQVTDAALAVLRAGGSAADAAVTAALVAGVTSPTSSGLGGGGFALVYTQSDQRVTALDFRETAPRVLDTAAFERRPLPATERGKLVGVPGEAAGLAELSRRYGKRPWRELVRPALALARDGFRVEAHLASVLSARNAADYRRMRSVDRAFYPGNAALSVGRRTKNPPLAATLGRLLAEGSRAIYEGAIADDIVDAARAAGSGITRDDLAGYRVVERVPLSVPWEGLTVHTMPFPSAGGLLLAEVLLSFDRAELSRAGAFTPALVHRVAEVMRAATADCSLYAADPDALPIDAARLLDPARLAARKARIRPGSTQTVRALIAEDHGTHCLLTADAFGNVVVLTTTINTAFGVELEGEASGIVLNDELDDFTARSASSALGVRFPPNAARPGVRPVSSMMPTIVLDGARPVLAIGGSGGTAIPPNVTEVLLRTLAFGESPDAAVQAPRFRPETREGVTLYLEPGFAPDFVADLARRGELTRELAQKAAVGLLSFSEAGLAGAADPRKSGVARVR